MTSQLSLAEASWSNWRTSTFPMVLDFFILHTEIPDYELNIGFQEASEHYSTIIEQLVAEYIVNGGRL
jgi:hypothetical protein